MNLNNNNTPVTEFQSIVKSLNLLPHPEGGFYKETYRSSLIIPKSVLADNFSGDRSVCTGIYFLLTSDNFSAFHRIQQDEMWHYYSGSPLLVHIIDPKGHYSEIEVGLDFDNGQQPQFVVPAGCWFASSVKEENSFSLVGCTVAPGFDFDDFELASFDMLSNKFPQHQQIIKKLTRS